MAVPGRAHLRFRLSIFAVVSLSFMVACNTRPTPSLDVETALSEGLCLAQVRSDEIEVLRLDGTWSRHKIPNARKSAPLLQGRLSPDGAFIAGSAETGFVGLSTEGQLIWRMTDISFADKPAISTDGKKVAFTGRDQQLTTYELSLGRLNQLRVAGQNPSWAPEGDRLAYDHAGKVRIYDLTRGAAFEVGTGTEPTWVDEARLALRVNPHRTDLVNLDSRERGVFIEASSNISVPRWSPNGEWVMYIRRGPRRWWSRAEWTGSEPSQILLRNVKTSSEASIGESYKADPADFGWVMNRELCQSEP